MNLGKLIRLHCTHFAGLLCGHLVLSLVILTFRLISFNEDHLTSISYHNFQSIIHEIYYHQAVVLIHFLSFQLISLPFSEWIELHQTGQLGLRLINTLQSLSIINFTNYIQIILNHLPLLIISIPYGFIIPLFNCILDKGFLLLSSSSQVIHRKDDSMMKQNDNLSVSSSTWIMNISTLCILSIAWLVTESLANITFNQQNSINNDNYQLLNIQKEIQKKSIKLINNQYQIKLYYYLYLIKYRIFIILIIISIYMLNDWILFIENIKFIDYSNSSLFLHYSSNLQFNHTISSTFILLCTSIWLLQFEFAWSVHVHFKPKDYTSTGLIPNNNGSHYLCLTCTEILLIQGNLRIPKLIILNIYIFHSSVLNSLHQEDQTEKDSSNVNYDIFIIY
ncbi:unnamed protein product [Schistosoma rodhaini]|nr:unnamed protein product [Schistosoma rodhaini]